MVGPLLEIWSYSHHPETCFIILPVIAVLIFWLGSERKIAAGGMKRPHSSSVPIIHSFTAEGSLKKKNERDVSLVPGHVIRTSHCKGICLFHSALIPIALPFHVAVFAEAADSGWWENIFAFCCASLVSSVTTIRASSAGGLTRSIRAVWAQDARPTTDEKGSGFQQWL